jgi:DNA polymerase I-like protein with 3'-5' exonuclease and polymerase domains
VATDWQVPTALPDLRRAGIIALDTETNDEGLRADRGSAWPWHGGYVCGISVAWRGENGVQANYFPLRHPDSENFERENVARWLKDLIAAGVRIVTQNGLYDWGWLRADLGIIMPPSDQLEEIGALATLINENRFSYRLDELCKWRGLPGKDTALLQEAVKTAGWAGRKKIINAAEHIYKLPAHLVGPYAEADPIATLGLFEDLNPILDQEGTRAAYRLDVDLLPMVHEMRRHGLRVDQSAAEQGRDYCLQKRDRALTELSEQLGTDVSMHEIASPKWKAQTFDAHGINYPRTEKGNPSFRAGKLGWMPKHPHWLPRLIATANKYEHAGSTFLEGHILAHLIGDRIYGEINPHRSEESGTKSFRFSYSNPPLQQMPSRDPELGPLIRSVFLPEDGELWCTVDCSQQEFRFVVHEAAIRNVPGVQAALDRYRNDSNTDFHKWASEITGIPRDDAKGVNFAKIYGAGVKKFAEMIGKPPHEAQLIYAQYDQKLPFISRLASLCQHEANRLGYTPLYDGARRHWDRWAPRTYSKGAGPCSLEEAQQRTRDPEHPWFNQRLQRVGIHTALNALIQGSAARHTKLWMRAVWREGIIPRLQMHDGLELSVTTREQGELVARLACEAVKLEVPMRADIKFGRNWGGATHNWEELHALPKPAPSQISDAPTGPVPSEPSDELVTVTGIRFMITRTMKEQLYSRGFSEQNVLEMTPQRAHELLAQESTNNSVGAEITPRSPSRGPDPTEAPAKPSIATQYVNGVAHAHFDSEILLKDIVDEPMVNGKVHCPFHDDANPSCHIYDDHYHCFACGAHGDAISWLREVEGLSFGAAQDALACWEPRKRERSAAELKDDGKTLARAQVLWDEAEPIAGTLAIDYLTFRHIDVDQLTGGPEAVLRFHPNCPFDGPVRGPCLLALYQDIDTNAFAGIHRIALTPAAFTHVPGSVKRRMLGRWAPRRRAVKLWPAKRGLMLGVGLETTLAAATRIAHKGHPLRPAWAMLSAGAIASCGPITGVELVVLLADNEPVGQQAAQTAAQLLSASGCKAVVLKPTAVKDFNDLVRARAGV